MRFSLNYYHIPGTYLAYMEVKLELQNDVLLTIWQVEINIPELNPEMVKEENLSLFLQIFLTFCFHKYKLVCGQDVYRIGTLMELVRVIALSFADDGKRVKVG